jgi:hypothetical protein
LSAGHHKNKWTEWTPQNLILSHGHYENKKPKTQTWK